jgi:uncharacterized protein (TIGR02145 family)
VNSSNETALISGATGASYTVLAEDVADDDPATVRYCCKVSSFGCNSVNSPVFTVINPEKIERGSGRFIGKRCFDIAVTDGDATNSCGSTTSRANQKTDFTNRESQNGASLSNPANGAYYSGVQVYTFTPSGPVSNVRFYYDELEHSGLIVESITPQNDYRGSITAGVCKVTVSYRESLQTALANVTRANAWKLKLYAVYYDGSTDKVLTLTVSLQDCSCCGAFKKPGEWLNFMCHNLGANDAADPFTPSAAIHGAKYKWGVNSPALIQINDQSSSTSISGWTSITPPPSDLEWNMSTANPCPAGWKLPSKEDWDGVLSNNTIYRTNDSGDNWVTGPQNTGWTSNADNYSTGIKFGDALVLPTAGYRNGTNGLLASRGSYGHYWSSTASSSSGYYMPFGSSSQSTGGGNRAYGFSVRCVTE